MSPIYVEVLTVLILRDRPQRTQLRDQLNQHTAEINTLRSLTPGLSVTNGRGSSRGAPEVRFAFLELNTISPIDSRAKVSTDLCSVWYRKRNRSCNYRLKSII